MSKSDDATDIPRRLKTLRKSVGLSQRQLSQRAGVSNATISQIESGAFSPTVGMLKKILDGVPMSLAEFFTYEKDGDQGKVFFKAHELIEISKGGVSYRQVGGNLKDKAIQLLRERYEPGADTGRHSLRHEGEECGLILSGRLTVTVAGETRTLEAGDAYYFASDHPHAFKNEGPVPCELITACTPPSF
ncbi:MAG: cupin domain-containing protein [Pseudomonadota bacterium]